MINCIFFFKWEGFHKSPNIWNTGVGIEKTVMPNMKEEEKLSVQPNSRVSETWVPWGLNSSSKRLLQDNSTLLQSWKLCCRISEDQKSSFAKTKAFSQNVLPPLCSSPPLISTPPGSLPFILSTLLTCHLSKENSIALTTIKMERYLPKHSHNTPPVTPSQHFTPWTRTISLSFPSKYKFRRIRIYNVITDVFLAMNTLLDVWKALYLQRIKEDVCLAFIHSLFLFYFGGKQNKKFQRPLI